MGCLQLQNYTTLQIAHTSNTARSREGKSDAGLYKYKYQGQERQDELGLNWDSFKWRNYDYAIGRFMNIDPLAEDYVYNTPYAIQENKMGLGIELEGLELFPSPLTGVMLSETTKPTIVENTMLKPVVETTVEVGSKIEGHHVIPKALKNNELVKQAIDEGFKFEGNENKIPLPKFNKSTGEGTHGNHPKYTQEVLDKLLEFTKTNENSSPQEVLKFMKDLSSELKEAIKANPDTKVNDLFRSEVNQNTVIESTGVKKPDLPRRVNSSGNNNTLNIITVI